MYLTLSLWGTHRDHVSRGIDWLMVGMVGWYEDWLVGKLVGVFTNDTRAAPALVRTHRFLGERSNGLYNHNIYG